MPQNLQTLLVLGIHLDVRENGEVITFFNASQMSLEISRERLVATRGFGQFRRVFFRP